MERALIEHKLHLYESQTRFPSAMQMHDSLERFVVGRSACNVNNLHHYIAKAFKCLFGYNVNSLKDVCFFVRDLPFFFSVFTNIISFYYINRYHDIPNKRKQSFPRERNFFNNGKPLC